MLTADENIVDIQFSVQYKVKDPVAWVFNNSDQVETVRGSAETAMRELVGRSKLDALLAEAVTSWPARPSARSSRWPNATSWAPNCRRDDPVAVRPRPGGGRAIN